MPKNKIMIIRDPKGFEILKVKIQFFHLALSYSLNSLMAVPNQIGPLCHQSKWNMGEILPFLA